jgi:hypothetical protein
LQLPACSFIGSGISEALNGGESLFKGNIGPTLAGDGVDMSECCNELRGSRNPTRAFIEDAN